MSTSISKFEDDPLSKTSQNSSPTRSITQSTELKNVVQILISELKVQRGIVLPLIAMNLTWFVKIAITTAFLGRLGELRLAGGTLGFTFANVTGFSVMNGLCGAMEPICGQAFGAKNFKLLHKTLFMTIFLLLFISVPVSILWLNVDKILIHFGQQQDISLVAKTYLFHLLPELVITSFLYPLKSYLSSQGSTLPIMFSSAVGLALHIPINIVLARSKGLVGVSMSLWIIDLIVVILLGSYVLVTEVRKGEKWEEGGWLDQSLNDWVQLLKLSGPCCFTTCLEWWCWEVLVLLTGRLANASQAVGVLAIVLNFDYLLFSFMLSLATCASIRVSNELGANQVTSAYQSAYVSLATGFISGCAGGLAMVAARGVWAPLYSHDKAIIRGVKKMMLLMGLVEVINFPLAVCGGILRGTARPWLGIYANVGGFYLLALPVAVVLAFKVGLGLSGLLLGFLVGTTACLGLLVAFIMMIDWKSEAGKARKLAGEMQETVIQGGNQRTSELVSIT